MLLLAGEVRGEGGLELRWLLGRVTDLGVRPNPSPCPTQDPEAQRALDELLARVQGRETSVARSPLDAALAVDSDPNASRGRWGAVVVYGADHSGPMSGAPETLSLLARFRF
jgi:hypothetical protein